jgi:hypothetical protein
MLPPHLPPPGRVVTLAKANKTGKKIILRRGACLAQRGEKSVRAKRENRNKLLLHSFPLV